jgi:endonuclease/exonuclease/phosphatase family metal-dependent hydrolase
MNRLDLGFIFNLIFLPSIGSFNLKLSLLIIGMLVWSCDPFVTQFEGSEDAVYYTASSVNIPKDLPDFLNVMTWNIRFGAGRIPWFGDSCGDRVILSENEVMGNLQPIIDFINIVSPDILLLQEVDVSSKRTGYIDQVQWLLDNSDSLNFGVYASMWKADFIPSDGLGKVDVGNAILSKWPIVDAERIQLPLREDQDNLTQYFYLRRNILKSKIKISDEKEIYALCTHTTAFATDDTKQKHINKFYDVLTAIDENEVFVAGGDLNALTSAYLGDERDFCEVDKCAEDVCDDAFENNLIYQGSYFSHLDGEEFFLSKFYIKFNEAIDSTLTNTPENYTHSTWITSEDIIDSDGPLNRKLDYIFSSGQLENGITHQDQFYLSDHAPVSATLDLSE